MESLLNTIYIPALAQVSSWGELNNKNGQSVRDDFLGKLDAFVSVLSGARTTISEKVTLSPCQLVDVSALASPAGLLAAAHSPETVEALEVTMTTWCKEIEQMLAKSEQMRKEADDIGPKAELEHWKKRTGKFNSLLSRLRSQECRSVVSALTAAKSKTLVVSLLPQFIFTCLFLT